MKKWYSYLEVMSFPLKMLFIAIVLMGIGDFFQNPNITPYIQVTNEIVLNVCEAMKYIGSFLIGCFPLLVILKMLSKRYEDSVPAYVGVVAYIAYLVTTMFVATTDLPSYCYSSIMGITMSSSNALSYGSQIVRYPLATGLVASIVVVIATRFCYLRSRQRFTYGILSFIDNDTWSLLTSLILTTLLAVAVSFGWPYFVDSIQKVIAFVSTDIYQPTKLFVYGVTERLLADLGLQDMIRNPFWFGTEGGSWMDNFGQSYAGDVNVWTVLIGQNVNTMGYGRFITPYYVLNLFAVPGMLIAYSLLWTDKLEKRRYMLFFLLAIIVSVFTGMLLPLELFLLFAAPLLFCVHILATGGLYYIFTTLGVYLGYTYSGTLAQAMPGTLISMLPYIGNPAYESTLITIVEVGVGYMVLYFAVTLLYYKALAGEFLEPNKNKKRVEHFIHAVGGVKNVRLINSSPNKISIHLFDPTALDDELMHEIGCMKITETRSGIVLDFGPISTIIKNGVKKEIKAYQEELRAKPAVQESENK